MYSDGAEEQRIWTPTKNGDNEWQGYADGVVGGAEGEIDVGRFIGPTPSDSSQLPSGKCACHLRTTCGCCPRNPCVEQSLYVKMGHPSGRSDHYV